MALMHCNYHSSSLNQNIDINIIIPTPEGPEQITQNEVVSKYNYTSGLPVLYLLHGAYGNYSSWVRHSNIERYVQNYGCAVVMASAENSFYHDMIYGGAYRTFFSTELPAFVKNVFNVSTNRDKTFIAGLSMGGYGAWYLALSNPDQYSKAASMSGALDLALLVQDIETGKIPSRINLNHIFNNGVPDANGLSDLITLYKKCVADGNAPRLYQACGTEDFLYDINLSVRDNLLALDADLVYEEGPGDHNWDFWDDYIKRVLKWIFPDNQ